MVHLRAKNIPSKGRVVEFLFDGDSIEYGQDFAVVELVDSGQRVIVKSNYEGLIAKTVKLGTVIKPDGILANIAIEPDEQKKALQKRIRETNKLEDTDKPTVYINGHLNEEALQDAEDDADNYSGAVMYDRYNQAVTPYSRSEDDLMDSPNKYEAISERDKEMGNVGTPSADRFAQMRANIAKSIKNNPNAKNEPTPDSAQLAAMSNDEAMAQGDLFATSGSTGVSKFRQLIQARKEKVMQDNDYQEVKDVPEHVDAMSKTDEKGRPLIMRNIIANRMEKFNQSGGDPTVLDMDIVATKENAILDKDKKQKEASEGKDMSNRDNRKDNLEVKTDDVYLRQAGSDDGQFGVSYGAYVDDEEPMVIDANEIGEHRGTIMPSKTQQQLMNEIKSKQQKSYAENKITNLYDNSKRWDLIKTRDKRGEIMNRMKMVEQGAIAESMPEVTSDSINGVPIPQEFLRELPIQNPQTGAMEYMLYKDTPEGKKEFASWLKSQNLFSAYKTNEELIEKGIVPKPEEKKQPIKEDNNGGLNTQLNNQEELLQALLTKLNGSSTQAKNESNETVNYLKREIDDLKAELKAQHKLTEAMAEISKKAPAPANNTNDTFNQMMQYMLMQNMMQNMNGGMQNQNQGMNADMMKQMLNQQLNQFSNKMNIDTPKNEPIRSAKKSPDDMVSIKFGEQEYATPSNNYIPNDNTVDRHRLNNTRNDAVQSMVMSQNYIPPLSISTEIDMTSILKLKHVLKQQIKDLKFPTISFIIKAASLALEEYPKLNSSYDPDTNEVVIKKYHNIGLATETSEGLIVPVLKFIEKLSLKEVAIDLKEMTERLRRGQLLDYETDGSTITIANYGNVGAVSGTATIFYPNAAVIGIGKIVKKPVVVDNEKLAIKAMMNMTLSVDQRIIDAAEAGRFLNRIQEILERPEDLTVN